MDESLKMANPRMSSYLPTIKCSMCAQDIEISMMGEHVCATASEPTPPPETNRTFENSTSGTDNKKASGFLKPRLPLARVDTVAANRPFVRQDQWQQMTPVSASSSYRTLSPFSAQPPRSATAPLPLRSPTSPPDNFSGSLDNGFLSSDLSVKDPSNQNRAQNENFLGGGRFEEPEQYAPVSPRSMVGGGLLQRMNTIAPGPFDIKGRRPSAQRSISNGAMDASPEERIVPMLGHKTQASIGSYNGEGGFRKPSIERNGYGGFGPPPSQKEEQLEPLNDAENRKDNARGFQEPTPYRRPSNAETSAAPSIWPNKASSSGPDLSRPLPPRGASFIGGRDERRLTNAPPVPGVDLASEFGVSNPYHTVSKSQSSTASEVSQRSNDSSRSSPPASISGSQRKPSNTTTIDLLLSDIKSSIPDLNAEELPPDPTTLKLQIPTLKQNGLNIPPTQPSSKFRDPAVQGGRLSPVSPRTTSPPPTLQRPAPLKNNRRPVTAKGNCKGCSLPIKGKSVSSADGRLSGRYHKQCFVCKTCSEPFATTSFYILDDAPYCERHYHKLNNSMCHACDRGIEGQYLETERRQKFHPEHFSCSDCKRVLKRDYFEMNGKVYCERDAFRRTQQRNFLGPGSRMEKRSTRLMMM